MKVNYNLTRIKWLTLFIFLLIINTSCRNNRNVSDLRIEKSKDTILTTEDITVNLHIENYKDSTAPRFHIIHEGNDYNIPFDDKMKCGVFKAAGQGTLGENIWHGYVTYYDKKGNSKKEEFSFSYFVK
ncbi:MAG: hypothetical protein AB9846_14115 [Tenuifilaceae bacterium]